MSKHSLAILILLAGLIMLFLLDASSKWFWILLLAFMAIELYSSFNMNTNYFYPSFTQGSKANSTVALTFDDGPDPVVTETILQILKKEGVTATFFCIGRKMNNHQNLIRQIHSEGHQVANHSYSHSVYLGFKLPFQVREEIETTNALIKTFTGNSNNYYRPPFGVLGPFTASALRSTKQRSIGWDIRSFDTVTPSSEKIVERVMKDVDSGSVILLHDICPQTAEALPRIIEGIKEKGLKFVTVDEMFS